MLNIPNKTEPIEIFEKEEKENNNEMIPLPHWTFSPGDGKFYIFIIKPLESKLIVNLNSIGDEIEVTINSEDLTNVKEIISKSLDIKKEFLNTHIESFCQKGYIFPPEPLSNIPTIHKKSKTHVLISFPFQQHGKGVLVF